MMGSTNGMRVGLGLMLVWLVAATALAAPRISGVKSVPRAILKLEQDYVTPLGTADSPLQAGSIVDVQLMSGRRHEGLEVADIQLVKGGPAFRLISFKPAKGTSSRIASTMLYQIRTADRVFDVVSDPATRSWLLLDQTKRDEVASARLQSQRHKLWETPGEEDVRDALTFYEELFQKAREMFPAQRFARVETKYFIFFTDMPQQQVAGYIANLDSMYDQLCLLFGLPKDTNIWVGKCPVIAFANQGMFQQFEAQQMKVRDTTGVAGLNHSWSDGRVVTICTRGDDPVFFAVVLVHETSHGFLHRIRSSSDIPPWMNEGIADWIAGVVVPQSDHVSSRMAEALPQIRATGSLGGNFLVDDGRIDRWQYGVAATLTQFLLSTDANAYRALITGIKEGYSWQQALELTYGVTSAELATAYGRQIGLPNLRP
jgi:hypothetical protein